MIGAGQMPDIVDPYAYPPRVLDLAAAARYLGLTPPAFSALVRVGQLPSARQLGVTAVWDRMTLDAAFEAASADEVQPNGKPVQKSTRRSVIHGFPGRGRWISSGWWTSISQRSHRICRTTRAAMNAWTTGG